MQEAAAVRAQHAQRGGACGVERVERFEGVRLVRLACCAACSRSADVAVVKLWWMPPTLRGVTGASSRWSMKLGASHGSGSGCLRPCSRRGSRVS